ncbi:MAG: hypothetical protein KDC27_07200, partial [Acidobacteria bacterium]|nr:hypothetical protein [Acidobacteriota bacterium]
MPATKADSLAAGVTVAALCMAMMAPATAALPAFAVLALTPALVHKRGPIVHFTLFAALWAGVAAFAPSTRVWPWNLLVPLLLYGSAYPLVRTTAPPFRAGR